MSAAWTIAEIAQLYRLAGQGFSAGQIATRLGNGRSRNAVIGKLGRNQIALANARSGMPRLTGKTAIHELIDGADREVRSRLNQKKVGVKLPSRAGGTGAAKPPLAAPVVRDPVVPASPVYLPATLPMTFLDAMFAGRCLHFVGDPFGADGPTMPVCGAERAFDKTGRERFCTRHYQSSHGGSEE